MDLIVAIIAAALGWKFGTLGSKELKAIAIIAVGWTTVTTLASIPHVNFAATAFLLIFRALLIGVPYAAGALAKRLRTGRG